MQISKASRFLECDPDAYNVQALLTESYPTKPNESEGSLTPQHHTLARHVLNSYLSGLLYRAVYRKCITMTSGSSTSALTPSAALANVAPSTTL